MLKLDHRQHFYFYGMLTINKKLAAHELHFLEVLNFEILQNLNTKKEMEKSIWFL